MWGAIISGVMGLAQLAVGANQKAKARKDAQNNTMPPYEISSLYGDTLGVAQREANYGFSPETLNAFTQTSQQNLASGAENILRGGGDINDIAKLYGIDNNARKNLAFENDKLRATKLQNLFDQSAQYAGQQAIQWRLNYFDRWKDRAVASASLLQGGNNMMQSGFNTLGNTAGQFANIAGAKQMPNGGSQGNGMDNGWHHNVDNINSDWMNQQVATPNNSMNWFGQSVQNPYIINNPSQPIY
jgi:hypothetical protein